MKKHILLPLIIGFIFTTCNAQNERIENVLMNCIYHAYADNGSALKKLIVGYENLLINEGLLVDNTVNSYRKLLQNIAYDKEFDKIPSKIFYVEEQKIQKLPLEKLKACQKTIAKDSALYNSAKYTAFVQMILKLQESDNFQKDQMAKGLLTILSDEDLELEFYKKSVFLIYSIIETNTGVNKSFSQIPKDGYDVSNVLKIFIDKENKILVDTKVVTIKELKKSIRAYELKNKSESVFSLKADRKALYKVFSDVQSAIVAEIQSLREELSKEKHNTTFDKLTKEQQIKIMETYPTAIAEY